MSSATTTLKCVTEPLPTMEDGWEGLAGQDIQKSYNKAVRYMLWFNPKIEDKTQRAVITCTQHRRTDWSVYAKGTLAEMTVQFDRLDGAALS